jgi:hypothetical protein
MSKFLGSLCNRFGGFLYGFLWGAIHEQNIMTHNQQGTEPQKA